jgi:hypothetical protein
MQTPIPLISGIPETPDVSTRPGSSSSRGWLGEERRLSHQPLSKRSGPPPAQVVLRWSSLTRSDGRDSPLFSPISSAARVALIATGVFVPPGALFDSSRSLPGHPIVFDRHSVRKLVDHRFGSSGVLCRTANPRHASAACECPS